MTDRMARAHMVKNACGDCFGVREIMRAIQRRHPAEFFAGQRMVGANPISLHRQKPRVLGNFASHSQSGNHRLGILRDHRAVQMTVGPKLGDDPVGQMARVHDRIEAGDFVALLGDRTGLNERTVEVTFFGEPAHFPAGPFLLASLMKCPVYLTFGLYRRPNRYDLSCEPFADKLQIPRKDREAGLKEIVQRFADRLEHHARLAPENWFNFYDFWNKERAPEASRTRHHR